MSPMETVFCTETHARNNAKDNSYIDPSSTMHVCELLCDHPPFICHDGRVLRLIGKSLKTVE